MISQKSGFVKGIEETVAKGGVRWYIGGAEI
jgi:hypothetical protein